MHPHAELLGRLYNGLIRHQPEAMAACYHPEATFRDIAFALRGRDQILSMWQMICAGDIYVNVEAVHADDTAGWVKAVDIYTFTDTGRKVHNPIESRFCFRDGLIIEHRDFCDPRAWANAALGGIKGFLAGRFRFLRARAAREKLRLFRKTSLRESTFGAKSSIQN